MNMKIIKTQWHKHQSELVHIRYSVFIDEQHVPVADEWDNMDDKASHYLLYINDEAIASARMLQIDKTGKIGRVAVLKPHRRKGNAFKLMRYIINDAKNMGLKSLKLDAQTYIIPFYEQLGFQVYGNEFMDAGIPHKQMQMQI